MQVVRSAAEVAAAVLSAQRLARAAFGNDRLLLERYFPTARHVEVQVFADSHGGIVALFDRDCSVQRRHQKIIEEAPAPGLAEEVRAAMAQAAITAARAVGYVGTWHHRVSGRSGAASFYFMEMNTRLQVEHPVTELITGIDLVGGSSASQAASACRSSPRRSPGAAPRSRRGCTRKITTYDYLPSVGRIAHLRWPRAGEGVRLDVGVEEGDEVSSFYDPMLGKLIAWGPSRAQAGAVLLRALGELEIAGVATNRALLQSVLADADFQSGRVATDFLARRHAQLEFGEPAPDAVDYALAGLWCVTAEADPGALWSNTSGWRLAAPPVTRWTFGEATVTLELSGPAVYRAQVGGEELTLRLIARQSDRLEAEVCGRIERLGVAAAGRVWSSFATRPACEPARRAH